MSLSVVDKYVAKKQKDLLEYASILESIITVQNNKMWSSKKTFANYAKDIITKYAESYYFDNNVNRNNPIAYSNDNINFVLKSIIEYFKEKEESDKLKDWKNETFLLSVLICTACYVDFATNVVDGNYQDTKDKFKFLLDYFKKTNMLEVLDNNKFLIDELFEAIKKNTNLDTKYLELLKGSNASNKYKEYSKKPLYYGFEFEYKIPDLEEEEERIAEDITKSYLSRFKEISFNLLCNDLLVRLISNEDIGVYLIQTDEILKKKASLLNIFDNRYYRDLVGLLVNFEDEADYLELISAATKIGIKVVYIYEGIDKVEDNFFSSNLEVLVHEKFIKKNKSSIPKWESNNVKFIIMNEEEL